jgi:hypothetical protein
MTNLQNGEFEYKNLSVKIENLFKTDFRKRTMEYQNPLPIVY